MHRHGPMVLGVCRRVLGNSHDAEDAFQATFVVLVRKAAFVVPREQVGNWLCGVAYHSALKAKAASTRRQIKEREMGEMARPLERARPDTSDLVPILDQELSQLPSRYRVPIVLCDLEDRPRKAVADELGLSAGALSGRLLRGRAMLARHLSRHGITLSASGVAGLLLAERSVAAAPGPLVASTVKAVLAFAASKGGATAGVSAQAVKLAEGQLVTMVQFSANGETVAWFDAMNGSIPRAGATDERLAVLRRLPAPATSARIIATCWYSSSAANVPARHWRRSSRCCNCFAAANRLNSINCPLLPSLASGVVLMSAVPSVSLSGWCRLALSIPAMAFVLLSLGGCRVGCRLASQDLVEQVVRQHRAGFEGRAFDLGKLDARGRAGATVLFPLLSSTVPVGLARRKGFC